MTLSQAVLSFLNIFDENLEQPLGSGQPTCKLYVAEQVGFASFERLWKLGSRAGSINLASSCLHRFDEDCLIECLDGPTTGSLFIRAFAGWVGGVGVTSCFRNRVRWAKVNFFGS